MTKKNLLLLVNLMILVIQGFSYKSDRFVHPGLLHTMNDLQRMKSMVAAERQPWFIAFQSFAADSHSSLSYSMQGPDAVVTRDVNPAKTNMGTVHLAHDSVAALQLALMYTATGNDSYAVLATRILEAWTETLIIINGKDHSMRIVLCIGCLGSDAQLAAALSGTQLVNAAEIIRYTYAGWSTASITKFEKMISDIFYPPASQTTPTPEQKYPL
jgi:hypothetical protein